MKKIFRTICAAAVALAALASCDQENIKSIYSPEQENEVSFAAGVYTNTNLPITADTVNIVITRSNANGALTVPLSNTMPAGITVPSTVEFADGEYQANVVIGLELQVATPYKGTISISDETLYNPNVSLYPSISVSLQADYTWVSLGEGEFKDCFFSEPVPVEIIWASDSPIRRYRVMNPYADLTDALVEMFGSAKGSKSTNALEFTVDENGNVAWDGCWYNGVLYNASIDYSDISYYYGTQSPFGGAANIEECYEMSDGLFQFLPEVSAMTSETGGVVWGNTYCFVSLPDAETSISDLMGL